MKKICIIGSPGAGKSTLSLQLSKQFNIPVYHLDKMFWQSDWVTGDKEDLKKQQQEVFGKDRWIIEGMYHNNSFRERMDAADAIIFLNYSRWLCFYRVLKRVVTTYGKVREDMAEGCPERFDWDFMKYIWNFHSKPVDYVRSMVRNVQDKTVLEFNKPSKTKKWLKGL